MKKIIIYFTCFLFCFICLILIENSASAYSKTGHDDFKVIEFTGDGELINTYSSVDFKPFYNRIKRKAFGWSTEYIQKEKEALYEGVTIFSRSNKTKSPVKFTYDIKETTMTEKSVKVKGSVTSKITGEIKKIKLGTSLEVSGSYEKSQATKTQKEESTGLTLTINPNKKLTMLVTGTCYVTSGVSKYFFCWINTKKGEFEIVDCETFVYELREEKL